MMSTPSYRVAYLLWFFIAFVFVLFSLVHRVRDRITSIGAYWSKWALRRRTWRKKHSLALARKNGSKSHQQPLSLPSNAQLLSMLSLFVVTLALSLLVQTILHRRSAYSTSSTMLQLQISSAAPLTTLPTSFNINHSTHS